MHVQLESISSRRTAQIERRNRVFRSERAAAAVREDERCLVREKRHWIVSVAWVA